MKNDLAETVEAIKLMPMDYRGRITIVPDQRSGQPCIREMRITVGDILEYLAGGMSREQILEDFPYLENEDITAALAFAAHREQYLSLAAS